MIPNKSGMSPSYLLIDDDPDDCDIFCIAIEEAIQSSLCEVAKNGVEALQKLDKGTVQPTVIFLDLNMPLMHGKDCLRELKNRPYTKDIPVIMYTTSSYSKDIADTQQLGAAHFLIKPSSLEKLVSLLKDLLQGNETSYVVS